MTPVRALALLWLVASIASSAVLAIGLPSPAGSERVSSVSAAFLPGETTHGHYQIELKCQACHDRLGAVREDSCLECHADALSASKDTHPKSKFDDPLNAALLTVVNARSCVACHSEHEERHTTKMGVSVPTDYCWQCHQDVAEARPSHEGMAYDSCATAGCHNYHDNSALYEKFLAKHHGEPDILDDPRVLIREALAESTKSLAAADHDGPADSADVHIKEWAGSAHAVAGVNCSGCHTRDTVTGKAGADWSNDVATSACAACHEGNMEAFGLGLHGMRIASGLSAMQPSMARLPMHSGAGHESLDCNACHKAHRDDTQFAAVDACVSCHADDHSTGYLESEHYALWQAEVAGDAPAGSGVSCATCHMPRFESEEDGGHDSVAVQHNQNATLEPNEKMARAACLSCHGLQFTLDSLADPGVIAAGVRGTASSRVESIDMAAAWFAEKERARAERAARREAAKRKRAAP